jgi:hypothetical protein
MDVQLYQTINYYDLKFSFQQIYHLHFPCAIDLNFMTAGQSSIDLS